MLSNSLAELDRRHLIHPVSSFRGHEQRGVRILTGGQGATVTDSEGRTLIDGFAGLWCVNAGYGHESIVEAAAEQMRKLPYATGYFDLGAEAPIRLAAALAERAPGDLDHVYFTLGGSDAVDSSIRFIKYYWHAKGQPGRDQFISVANGYHGSTTMGAGLTALPGFHDGFGVPYDWQHKISSHDLYRHPAARDPQAVTEASVAELRAKIESLGPDRVAAFYVEPIQGSGGVLVPPKGWIKAMRDLCTEYGVLFVADEVITGFGRTGPLFACEDEGIVPDLMTTAKGLTSGYVPMGAVFMRDHVYETIADGAGAKAVGHGFTYSAHPVCAAAGVATLDLVDSMGLVANAASVGAHFKGALHDALDGHANVAEVRGTGLMLAVEFMADPGTREWFAPMTVAPKLAAAMMARGVIARPLPEGNIIGFAPPLCLTKPEADRLVSTLKDAVTEVLG